MNEFELIKYLQTIPLFEATSRHEQIAFSKVMSRITLEENEILYSKKESLDRLFLLYQGEVTQYLVNREGSEKKLETINESEVFPMSEILSTEGHYTANAKATKNSIIYSFPYSSLEAVLNSNALIKIQLIRLIQSKLQQVHLNINQEV